MMDWSIPYTGCFVLGLAFVGLTAALGKFTSIADLGADAGDLGGHDGDLGDGVEGVKLPIFSPTILAVFVGMFGAGGLFFLNGLGLTSPLIHLPGALGVSASTGVSAAWLLRKLMRAGETNAVASHRDAVGHEAEVTVSIRGKELGEIAFTSGGTRQTVMARSESGLDFPQGERVQVLDVVEGVAFVGPPGTRPPIQVSVVEGEPIPRSSRNRTRTGSS